MADWYDTEIAEIAALTQKGRAQPYTQRDMVAFRENSEQLEQFLDGDWSSMDDEIRERMPNAHKSGMTYDVIPLVSRYAHEIATLYNGPTRRVFSPNEDTRRDVGRRLTRDEVMKLREVYARSNINTELHKVHRRCTALNQQTIAVFPAGPRKVQVYACSPHDVEFRAGNPLTVADVQSHAMVRLRVPQRSEDGEVWWAHAVFTATEAYYEIGARKVPIYNAADSGDLSHDFGRVPLMTVRAPGAMPPAGHYFSELPEDMLTTQLAVNLAMADLTWGLQFSWPEVIVEPGAEGGLTQELVEGLPTGPNIYKALPGAGSRASVVNKQAPVDAYLRTIESKIRHFAIMRDMSPDAFAKHNTAKTAASRAFDRADREATRKAWQTTFRDAENELVALVGWVLNGSGLVSVPHDELRVSIDWQEWEMPADPLHEAQARALDYASGADSPFRYVMRRDGVTLTQAIEIVRRNAEETRAAAALGVDLTGNMNRAAPAPDATE